MFEWATFVRRHLACLTILAAVAHAEPPNVMIILVDDMGYSDLGCYGGEIKTPVIDGLADAGLRYTRFHNTGRCWPTRASMLTGYYAQQVKRDQLEGLPGGMRGARPSWAPLLPKRLKSAGYRSYHSGKWHIDGTPEQNGFDRHFYFLKQEGYFHEPTYGKIYKEFPELKEDKPLYSTTAIADHTIGVLRDHDKEHKGTPFFHYVAFIAPHFPLHALQEDIEKVGDRYKPGWEEIRARRWERIQKLGLLPEGTRLSEPERQIGFGKDHLKKLKDLGPGEVGYPVHWDTLTDEQKAFQSTKMAIYAAMIERADVEVGRIVQQLRSMDALENTLLFILSDNGASMELTVRGGHDTLVPPGSDGTYLCLGPGWSISSNTPFRKHKKWTHEGGARTPLVVHWPKGIAAKGELRKTNGHVIDIVPTIMELAEIDVDQKVAFPGQSMVSTFGKDLNPDRQLWWSHSRNHAMQDGDWKLVRPWQGEWELYNMAEDPTETQDLSAKHPEKVRQLEALWNQQVAEFRKQRKLQ